MDKVRPTKMMLCQGYERWSGWWVEFPTEIVYGDDDVEVVGKLCIIKSGNLGVSFEWQNQEGKVI
jgi:hypothetical protein